MLYCEHYVAAFFCFLRHAISCILLMPGGGSPPPPPAAFFGTGGAPPFFAGPFAPALGTGGAPPPPAFCFLRHAISLLTTTVCVRRPRGEWLGRPLLYSLHLAHACWRLVPSVSGWFWCAWLWLRRTRGRLRSRRLRRIAPTSSLLLLAPCHLPDGSSGLRQTEDRVVRDRCCTHCILLMPGGGSSPPPPPPPPGLGGLGVPAPDPFRAAGFGVGGFGESPPPAFCFLRHAISLLAATGLSQTTAW